MQFLRRHKLLVTAGLLLLLGFVVVRAATSRPSLELALHEVQEQLQERLGLDLAVGHMVVQPGSARFEIAPVLIKDSDGVVLFSADRIAMEVAPLRMFARRVQVDDVVIENPRVHLRVTRDGRILGVKPVSLEGQDSDSDPLFRVDVEDFRVENGEVLVDIEDLGSARVSGIKSRLRSSGKDGHRLKFSVDRAAFERPGDVIETDRFQGRLIVFGDGLLSPERVTVSDITLRAPEGTFNLAGTVVLGPLDQIPALDLDVHGTTSLPLLTQHVHEMPVRVEGDVAVGAHISAGLGASDLQVVGQGDVGELKVDGFRIGTLRGQFEADKRRVHFPEATWQLAGTTMDCVGTFELNEAVDFSYEVSGADLSIYELLAGLQIDGSWVDVLVDGEVKGSGHVLPEFEVSGSGRGHFHELVVGKLDARKIQGEDDVVLVGPYDIAVEADFLADLRHLDLDGFIDDGITRADGVVTLFWDPDQGFEIFAEAGRAGFGSIDNAISGVPFDGTGSFQLQVSGPYVDPLVVAQGQAENFVIDGFELADTGQSHIRYKNGSLGFHGIHAKKGESVFEGDVLLDWWKPTERYVMTNDEGARVDPPTTVALKDGMQITADMDIVDGEVRDLREMIPLRFEDGALAFFRDLDMDGPIKGQFHVGGYIGDGSVDHLTGRAAFALGQNGHLLGQTLDGGHVLLRLLPGSVFVDNIVLHAAGGRIAGTTRIWRDDAELKGPLTVRGLQLGGLDVLKDTGKPWQGSVDADVELFGLAENPQLRGDATLVGAAWGDVPIGDAQLQLSHADRILRLIGPVMTGRGVGRFDVGTEAPFPYTADIDVKGGPARPLLPPDLLPADLSVVVGGEVQARGELSAFGDSRGNLDLDQLKIVHERGMTMSSESAVLAHFRGDEVTLDQLELVSGRGDRLSAGGSFSADNLDLSLGGRGDLWLITPFVHGLRSSAGRFTFDLVLAGDYDDARLSGRASLSGARFDVEGFDPAIDGLDARLQFTGTNVVIENMRGTLGGAPFRGDGAVTLNGLKPKAYDLKMSYKDLKLTIPEWLPTRSSGEVTLTGDADFPTLAGEVQLHQATYSEDINWERLLPDVRRKSRAPRVYDKEEEDLRFDLHLVSDGGIVVENNVADIEAKGDLYLVGTEERPGLRGTLSLLHGLVDFRNNRYRLTRGNVEFTETYAIAPLLDVEAETSVKDYDITAHVTGPLKNLRIDLSSRPDLAEIDILALLTFGFTQVELQDTTGTATATGLEVVSAYTGLEEEVKRILPEALRDSGVLKVDELRLTSQFSSRQQGSVPAVSVGFEVNPGFWGIDGSKLRLQSTLLDSGGAGTDQRIEWEKRFENNLRLRLVWNSQDQTACPQCNNQWGDVGGDVWYRWEF